MSKVIILISLCYLVFDTALAQSSIVLVDNQRIPISEISIVDDQIEIVVEESEEIKFFKCDSVYGYGREPYSRNYYMKQNPDIEYSSYFFLKRLELGKVSAYENEGGGQQLYLEKDGNLEKVLVLTDKKYSKYQGYDIFKSFVEDDPVSLAYINAPNFKYKWKEIIKVIQYYNERSFGERKSKAKKVLGDVYLYRTKFQKTDEVLKIRLNGQDHDLYIEDYIILSLPVDFNSKLEIRDSKVKNQHVMSGKILEQYFEVLYDSKTNRFRLDKKVGTELQYEFYKIKDKVGDRVTHD